MTSASENNNYPTLFLDEIRARMPLDRQVTRHVTLKRSGSALRGPCPIHGSAKGSTSFSVRHGRYRCFACGERGDVFAFTMWSERIGFTEAVRRLAHDAGLAMPGEIRSTPGAEAAAAQRRRKIEERRARQEAEDAAKRAADIAAALAYWLPSEPLDGTLGERYLITIRKIEKPATGWPASLRYHAASRSIVAALTTADGAVQAVHRTLLAPTGDNLRHRDTGRKLKLARGPQDGACTRLPGTDPASPILLHGEGLETGLSPWSVAGYEASVYFGNIADRAQPERGRVNVVLVDDDGPDAAKRIEAKVEQWAAEGYCVLLAPAFDAIEGGGRDWNDLLRDRGTDAVRDRINSLLPPIEPMPAPRPTATIAETREATRTAIEDYFTGRGPRHPLLTAACSVGKTSLAIEIFAQIEAERRADRNAFIQDYRWEHQVSEHAAARAADEAGLPLLRARYFAETHVTVGQTLDFARSLGLPTAHDGGYDQPFDPTKPGPAACTEGELRLLTLTAGAPMPTAACGVDLLGPHCPQRETCGHWVRRSLCGTATLVGMVIDRAFDHSLPRELSTGFDFTIVDEGLDRVQFAQWEMPLDLLADHHFEQHPVLTAGEPDDALTEEARAGFAWLRYVLNGVERGYLPVEERDTARLLRLIELTEARDAEIKLSPATSRDDRASIARQSFRPAIRKLCGFLRAWADGPGRISIERDPTKHGGERQVAIVRPKRSLHPSFADARVLLIDATADLDHVRQLLPDAVEIAPPAPVAPYQTVVHFQMVAAGKRAMRRPGNKAYHQALAAMYAGDGDGLMTHQEHEEEIAGTTVIRSSGHYFALTGRRDWEKCSTVLGFGLPSLSPSGAANLAAAQTGEIVAVEMPRRVLHPVPMSDGSTEYVVCLGYADPAIRAAQRSVQDRQAIQGPAGRPRGPNRTADGPVTLIYTGRKPLPGVSVDVLFRSWGAHAPQRFVRAVAAGRIVEGSPDRSRLLPEIYWQWWTGADDRKHEIGGTLATLKRALFPPWPVAKGKVTRPWLAGRYYVAGRGHRRDGRFFACELEKLDQVKAELRETCRAVRFEITHPVLKPDGPALAEVLRAAPKREPTGRDLSTSPSDAGRMPPWMVPTPAEGASSTRAPPDG